MECSPCPCERLSITVERGHTQGVPGGTVVLYLKPFAADLVCQTWEQKCRALLAKGLKTRITWVECDPPYEVEDRVLPASFWVRPHDKDAEKRRLLLRKQIFASLVQVLGAVVRYRPRIIIGAEQGALIAALCARPLVIEVACRTRIVTSFEMASIRSAWAGVVAAIAVDPLLLPQKSEMNDIRAAVPEAGFEQPWGIRPVMVTLDRVRHGPVKRRFGDELSFMIGKQYGLMSDVAVLAYAHGSMDATRASVPGMNDEAFRAQLRKRAGERGISDAAIEDAQNEKKRWRIA